MGMEKMTTGAWNSSQKTPELHGMAASHSRSRQGKGDLELWDLSIPSGQTGVFGKNGSSLCFWDKMTSEEFRDKEKEFLEG